MSEELNLETANKEPIRIRWLNAADRNDVTTKPIARYPQTIKTTKLTAPSVNTKAKTKSSNVVRFASEDVPSTSSISLEDDLKTTKGLKELSVEDKLKIANLIKELARIGHEKDVVQTKLEQERKLFEVQMKTLLNDYEKLMKDNQKLFTRYSETKSTLNEYEKKLQEYKNDQQQKRSVIFPDPQRSSTPIDIINGQTSGPPLVKQNEKYSPNQNKAQIVPNTTKSETDLVTRTNAIVIEQFQIKQLMMEKQLQLLHKQQQILEEELRHRKVDDMINYTHHDQVVASSKKSTVMESNLTPSNVSLPTKTTRSTSPIKNVRSTEPKMIERATSPVKLPSVLKSSLSTVTTNKIVKPSSASSEKQANRKIQQYQNFYSEQEQAEDELLMSLSETTDNNNNNRNFHEKQHASRLNPHVNMNNNDMEYVNEQKLLNDIFFIC